MRHAGRTVALGTRHGKERAFAPPLLRRLGLSVTLADIDTDQLGTFSGEVERQGTPRDTVITKARLAAEASGLPLGLASEGSFGPHPSLPWLAMGHELACFLDLETGLTLVESRASLRTNFGHATGRTTDDIADFLARARFPSHAVIARPNAGPSQPLVKGIRELGTLAAAMAAAAETSPDRLARVETDMRAHLNPTRMGEIRKVAVRLARRLATPCPACAAPGFGPERVVPGLPCGWCGEPTPAPLGLSWRCPACDHAETRPRPHQPALADPGQCPGCNP